jgi:hypothetical protein
MDHVRRNLLLGVPAAAAGASLLARAALADTTPAAAGFVQPGVLGTPRAQVPAPGAQRVADPSELFRRAKEDFINEAIEISRAALTQDSVREAMAWEGECPQSALFRAIELPILAAHLDETKYNVTDLRRRYPVQMGLPAPTPGAVHRHTSRLIASLDKDRDAQFRNDGYLGANYGNCFYWNAPDLIVTTEHLAELFPDSAKSLRKDGLDISVAIVGEHLASQAPEQIIYDDPSVSDADIQGNLVCIVGRDPDVFSDMDGAKVYPGIAVKMTPEFVGGALSEVSQGNRRGMSAHDFERFIARVRNRMDNAYMMMLPPGEARAYPDTESELPCQGMSSSPVFGFIRGAYRPVGIFFSAMCLEDVERRRSVDVAFFHPISAIRRLAGDPKAYWTLK